MISNKNTHTYQEHIINNDLGYEVYNLFMVLQETFGDFELIKIVKPKQGYVPPKICDRMEHVVKSQQNLKPWNVKKCTRVQLICSLVPFKRYHKAIYLFVFMPLVACKLTCSLCWWTERIDSESIEEMTLMNFVFKLSEVFRTISASPVIAETHGFPNRLEYGVWSRKCVNSPGI